VEVVGGHGSRVARREEEEEDASKGTRKTRQLLRERRHFIVTILTFLTYVLITIKAKFLSSLETNRFETPSAIVRFPTIINHNINIYRIIIKVILIFIAKHFENEITVK